MPCKHASKKGKDGSWTLCNGTRVKVVSRANPKQQPQQSNRPTAQDRKDAEARAKSGRERASEMMGIAAKIEAKERAKAIWRQSDDLAKRILGKTSKWSQMPGTQSSRVRRL